MKRFVAVFSMLIGLLVPLTAVSMPTAQAYCPEPDGVGYIYRIRNIDYRYFPTNVKSAWAIFPYGGTISYNETETMEVNASATATVSAEAGAIFAKASVSASVTIGGSYARSKSWSYTTNVPADRSHKYRLHAYHYSVDFSVMKKRWSHAQCGYTINAWSSWQRVNHAPAKGDRNVWRVDRADA